ncbi:MAG: hypothetical protein FJW37_06080 [Acidobacteria bacterium]|nr:hypothetical protein [Acidobacteriota bacterium]
MLGYRQLESDLIAAFALERRPVAVSFVDTPPAGVRKFTGAVPSSCTFWKLAAAGPFYTVPEDHLNCPVGGYTHHVELPQERARELEDTLGLMSGLGYINMQEIPQIFRMPEAPRVIVYAPLGDVPVEPDVVLFAAPAARIMLLMEAARSAGAAADLPLLGRPTCMALPAALARGAVASSGCIGNRTYTDIGEGELYCALPGKSLERVAGEAAIIRRANAALAEHHQARREALTSSGV